MAVQQCLPVLWALLVVTLSEPTPGRIPKVYNALITSNQNLEPSKAFPLYQPVLHNTFPFPLQTVVYGDLPLANGLLPVPASLPKDPNTKSEETPSSTPEPAVDGEASEKPTPVPEESAAPEDDKPTPATPVAPKTESPILLNQFGLPAQVLPLGRINPAYHFTQLPTFPYGYPGLRFYDPYDPFSFHTYANWPLYQPLTNFLGSAIPIPTVKAETPTVSSAVDDKSSATPPPEPSDLNVLNYSAKDPAIPNVPPPPLPQGGLKANTE